MLNKTFFAVTDQNIVFPITVIKEIHKDNDVISIRTVLLDPENTPKSAQWHHEEFLELIYVSPSNKLMNRAVFDTEAEANEFAIKNIDEKIEKTNDKLKALMIQRESFKKEI